MPSAILRIIRPIVCFCLVCYRPNPLPQIDEDLNLRDYMKIEIKNYVQHLFLGFEKFCYYRVQCLDIMTGGIQWNILPREYRRNTRCVI